MHRLLYFAAIFITLTTQSSCKKEAATPSFYAELYQPYTTGVIKLQYQVPSVGNGASTTRDTIAIFNSIGNNPSEKDDYGYSKPSVPWVALHRINPNDFQNRTFISFTGTVLSSLTFPYKFKKGDPNDAQINYIIGLKPFYDNKGNLVNGTNTYAASTYSGDFELTVLSLINNRLNGLFSGTIKNQDGLIIQVEKGLFDIEIVEK
jgi:hypothetical protein